MVKQYASVADPTEFHSDPILEKGNGSGSYIILTLSRLLIRNQMVKQYASVADPT